MTNDFSGLGAYEAASREFESDDFSDISPSVLEFVKELPWQRMVIKDDARSRAIYGLDVEKFCLAVRVEERDGKECVLEWSCVRVSAGHVRAIFEEGDGQGMSLAQYSGDLDIDGGGW